MDTATGLTYFTQNWGIRKRALVLGLAPSALVVLLLTAYCLHAQLGALTLSTTRRGQQLSRELAAVAMPTRTYDQRRLSAIATALQRDPAVIYAAIRNGSHNPVVLVPRQATGDDHGLVFRSPISAGNVATGSGADAQRGWAEIQLSRAVFEQRRRTIIGNSIMLGLLGLAVSAVVALWLSRYLLRAATKSTNPAIALDDGHVAFPARGVAPEKTQYHGVHRTRQAPADDATENRLRTSTPLQEDNHLLAHLHAAEGGRVESAFLTSISREVGTPINAISGFSNLLLKTPLNREQRDYTCTVRDAANGLLTRIHDILDFSRIAAGDLQLEHAPFDLRHVVDHALSIMASAAYDKHLDLVLLFYRDVPELLLGDGARIRRMLVQLLGNAIHFTRRGRIVMRVMIEAETADDVELRISVQDAGGGLSGPEQKRLWDALAIGDLHAVREAGEVGIGLWVCKQLAKRMGGTIGMEGAPDTGATYWFSFRAVLQTDGEPQITTLPPFAGVQASVFERDELHRAALTAQLEAWGIQVELLPRFSNLQTRLTSEQPPPLLFIGLRPEELEDPDVDNLLNYSAEHPLCAVIILLGTVNRRLLEEAVAAGATVALPKIVARSELHAVLEQALYPSRSSAIGGRSAAGRRPDDGPPDLSATRILVVDDNDINRKLMGTLYGNAGAAVDTATDGEAALRLLTTNRYDLILMDIQMPGMNGIEAVQRIRSAERERRRTPAVAVTAAVWPGERERLIRAGFDDCVIKPVQEDELWEMAYRWVEAHKLGPCEYWAHNLQSDIAEPDRDGPYQPLKPSVRARAIRIAGGNEQLAKELFAMLLAELPDMRRCLNDAFEIEDFETLESEAHKLHGAASYCAVESLKTAAARVERATKNRDADLGAHMDSLNQEMEWLLADHSDEEPE